MKQHLLSFFLLIFLCSSASAQFIDFPNLVTTDTDGNSYNLQEDYLDQGKPVLVHFFATWNMWDEYVLEAGSLQQAYQLYGPEGLDRIGIMGFEIDESTDDESINGDNQQEYNFGASANFPLINLDNPGWGIDTFGVAAMPSFALICPDGTVLVSSTCAPLFEHILLPNNWSYEELLSLGTLIDFFELGCGLDLPDANVAGYTTFDSENCDVILENEMLATKVIFDDGSGNPFITYSLLDGKYEYTLPNGTFDLTYEPLFPFYTICEQESSITIDNDTITDVNAIFNTLMDCPSMQVNILPWLSRPCGVNSYLAASVCNAGPVGYEGGLFNIQLQPGSSVITTSPFIDYTYDSVLGVFSTDLDAIASFECVNFVIQYENPCTVELDDTLCYSAFLDLSSLEAGCEIYSQGSTDVCIDVIGSYDPNDKRGMTMSDGENNYIDKGTELEYMIRFQNTGTDTAFTVRIEDQLSDQFVIESIRPIMASHEYSMSVADRKLQFLFDDIKLVDSFKNEPESHGFVTFKITIKDDLEPGEEIFNDAAIFFDGNDPVITNDFKYTIRLVNSLKEQDWKSLEITPNPVTDFATIKTDLLGTKTISVTNVNGSTIVFDQSFTQDSYSIDLSSLNQGIYFVHLINENGLKTEVQRLIKF